VAGQADPFFHVCVGPDSQGVATVPVTVVIGNEAATSFTILAWLAVADSRRLDPEPARADGADQLEDDVAIVLGSSRLARIRTNTRGVLNALGGGGTRATASAA